MAGTSPAMSEQSRFEKLGLDDYIKNIIVANKGVKQTNRSNDILVKTLNQTWIDKNERMVATQDFQPSLGTRKSSKQLANKPEVDWSFTKQSQQKWQ